MFAKKVNNGLACSVVCNTQLCDESFSRSMKQNACLSVEALEERVAVPGVDDEGVLSRPFPLECLGFSSQSGVERFKVLALFNFIQGLES